ncbi:hypothetical protein W97_08213 [Coniosporium apollinis CBS 100218]|uniref:alpha-1,2-Mannosidase n=1 Tax=Coniosporium apollinis (strain CBS 100218) TaxID=1168221 RepID=R7Z440_CONA1|nr:uncharacterized protein W97_08213 [Coniosporium apollinis CBS 100218]EON68955.1 hypothetical protein W97_08213 [Coniosporium apollinis CBS 100218]
MALLKRYTLYAAIAFSIFYLYRHFSSPSWLGDGRIGTPKAGQDAPLTDISSKSSFDWSKLPIRYPVESLTSLPTGKPRRLPQIQHKFEPEVVTTRNTRIARRDEIKGAFQRCWKAYKDNAWMRDEVTPISGRARDNFGGWAASLIDALDTLWIMGLKDEFKTAVAAVDNVDFGKTSLETVNVFETTIRHLGGLLSAYELSGEKTLLAKAIEVGEMLYVAFDTPNRMPITRWDFSKAQVGEPQVAHENVLEAEIGSLTMEFARLSQITGNTKWYDAVARIMSVFAEQQDQTMLPGMWPLVVNARDKNFKYGGAFTLAAMADSLYEYLAKTYALLGGLEPMYKKLYDNAMAAAAQHTLYRPMTPDNADILMAGMANVNTTRVTTLDPQGQHLGCFAGGMYALGGRIFENQRHVEIGRKLTDGCVWAYKNSRFGMMPEVFHMRPCGPNMRDVCEWDEVEWMKDVAIRHPPEASASVLAKIPKGFTSIKDGRYILRPEAIESVFILYRITGDEKLRDAAWEMWLAIQKYTKTPLANAALLDVTVTNDAPTKMDSMESFWMAETLKYFYLVFSEPDLISLDDYVFNTEAHPFKIPK